MTTTTTFETGRTYQTRSICDHNCIISITVASRTAKMLTTTEGKKLRISIYRDVEQVSPDGRYSMAPIIGADDTAKLLTDWERDEIKVSEAVAHVRNLMGAAITRADAIAMVVEGLGLNNMLGHKLAHAIA